MLGGPGQVARGFERRRATPGCSQPHAGARRRFVERTTGTGPGCGRLLHAALAAFESWRLGVGAGARRAARSDEASGREVGRGACGALADPGWRCPTGSDPGGGGEPGTVARTEAGDRGGAAQGQKGTTQVGAAGREWPHPARGSGGPGPEGAGPRAPVGVRGGNGERAAWESNAPLARRCGATAPAGTYAPGPASLVYRPSCLEQRTHCLCLSGAVVHRGTVPPGPEGRDRAMGSFAPMGRQFVAAKHVRHGDWFDVGEPGSLGAWHPAVGSEPDEDPGRSESHVGASAHERAWPPRDGDAGAGLERRTAQVGQELRPRALDAYTSFI